MEFWLSAMIVWSVVMGASLTESSSELEDQCIGSFSCLNGGVCMGEGTCRCLYGWTGVRCDRKNPCLERRTACKLNESCQFTVDGSVKCSPKLESPCAVKPSPCENGGLCMSNGSSTYRCLCTTGWTGERCDVLNSICARGDVCLNNGTCLDVKKGFQCFCQPGFTGRICEQKVRCPVEFDCPVKSQNGQCDPECHSLECGLDGGDCLVSSDDGWTIPGILVMVIKISRDEDFSKFSVRNKYLNRLGLLLNATVQISNLKKIQSDNALAISLIVTQYNCRLKRCFKSMEQIVQFINSAIENHIYQPDFQILKLIARKSSPKSDSTSSREIYVLIFGIMLVVVGVVFILIGIHTHRQRVLITKTWTPPVGQTVGERLLPSPDHNSRSKFTNYTHKDSRAIELNEQSPDQDITVIESAILESLTSAQGATTLSNPEVENLKKNLAPENERISDDIDLNKPVNQFGETLLHLCARYNCGDDATKLLLKYGARTEVVDNCGRTPIATAAAADALETLPTLLDHHCAMEESKNFSKRRRIAQIDSNTVQKSDLSGSHVIASPLIESIKAYCEDSALMLMDRRVVSILVIDQYGWTALHWAVVQRLQVLVERILYNRECTRAFVNQADSEQGRTPLHLAVRLASASADCLSIVRLLVEVGNARSDIKDIHEKSARDLAQEMEAYDVLRILEQNTIHHQNSDSYNEYLAARTVSSAHTFSDHSQCSSLITSPVHSQHSESSHIQSFEYVETQI